MRRGFTLVEVIIALAIASLLLSGLFASLQGSIQAYRASAAEGVNSLTARLLVERIALLVRTGVDFGPLPTVATENEVESNVLEITTQEGQDIEIEWHSASNELTMTVDGTSSTVLGGVVQTTGGSSITPFLLQFEHGTTLQRVTINLAVVPDPEHATAMDGGDQTLRFTTSVMPRGQLYE
ncbi:MAG: type II secretion system protein [Phycisphaerales bacterium]|jgi:prepilin-type N-terminal cleavage/methylation domain-containing protein|nr:type II secretion system protein [Phycisphaerales bacterium]